MSGQFPDLANELRQQMSEFHHGQEQGTPPDLTGIGGTVHASIYHARLLDFFPSDDIEAFGAGMTLPQAH